MVRFSTLVFVALLLLGVSQPWAQDSSVQPSKRTLYLRARDVLKTSLESGDHERADQAFNYLKTNAKEGAPLTRFEEYLINMELKNFTQGIEIYADLRRTLLDSTYKPERDIRVTEPDPLAVYLYRDLHPFTLQKADSLCARVDSSDVSDEYKELYRLLLYSELAIVKMSDTYLGRPIHWTQINDTTCAGMLLDRGKKFVDAYPASPYARVLDEQTLPYVEKVMKPLRDFRVDPLKHKYYTGGLGLFIGQWLGFMTGDATDFFDTKMGSSFIGEVSLQIRRLSLNALWAYGLINREVGYRWDASEDELMGLSLGFTAFDSRFLKTEPFIGVGEYNFMTSDAEVSTVLLLGLNADVRLLATKPQHIGGLSFALIARFKYMMQFGTYSSGDEWRSCSLYSDECTEGHHVEAGFMSHLFSLSLGVYLW